MPIGTREQFRNWLQTKGLTYSAYQHLKTEAKAPLYAEYQQKMQLKRPR